MGETLEEVIARKKKEKKDKLESENNTSTSTFTPEGKRKTENIDLNLLEPNPEQPRINFNDEYIEELANSIYQNEQEQAISVSKNKDNAKYTINDGECRWRAIKLLREIYPNDDRFKTIRAEIENKELSNIELFIKAVTANEERKNLEPIELGLIFKLKLESGMFQTQKELAIALVGNKDEKVLSNKQKLISKYLKLVKLPSSIIQDILNKKYSDTDVLLKLNDLKDEDTIFKVYGYILNNNLNREEAKEYINSLTSQKQNKSVSTEKLKHGVLKKIGKKMELKLDLSNVDKDKNEKINSLVEELKKLLN